MNKSETKTTGFERFIMSVSKVLDKIPHPAIMYVFLAAFVVLLSAVLGGTEFMVPGKDAPTVVYSLFSRGGLEYMLTNMFKNFTGLNIVGLLIGLSIAVGIGEKSGFYNTFVTRLANSLPEKALIAGFLFVCINGNLLSDSSAVLLPPIGAVLFQARGRNPMMGILIAAFGYGGGLSANILLAGTDANVSAITIDALSLLPATANMNITMMSNYYFMCASAFVLTAVGTLVATKITEPLLEKDTEIDRSANIENINVNLSDEQKKGLRASGIAAIIFFAILLACVIPSNGLLRNANGQILPKSPLMSSIPQLLFLFFSIVGSVYGFSSGTMKTARDLLNGGIQGLRSIAPTLVTFFVSAQFINYLSKTNLASLFAIRGATFLSDSGFTGIPLIIGLVILVALVNLMIGSVSSKWAMLGPIFIPMFALLGFSPAFTQCIYRVGDALTNPINPLGTNIPMYIGYAQRYKKSAGVGTIISHMIPYLIASSLAWTGMLIIWYIFKLPLGPGAYVLM